MNAIVRWGILGCGDVVRKRVANAIAEEPRSCLVAACRRDANALAAFASDFAISQCYTRSDQLLANKSIDAVYIATPVHQHCDQTIAAAEAGKHVLVEKPMAMSTDECDRMIAACRDNRVKLGVAYYRRFYPVVARIRELLVHETIGSPLSISASVSSPFRFDPKDDGSWRVDLSRGGGGALMDIGSHRIDLFLDLFGEIADTKAFCATLDADYEAESIASLIIQFTSGRHGMLQCYFGSQAGLDELVIVGTEGHLRSPNLNGGELVIRSQGKEIAESHSPWPNFNSPLVADFVDAIQRKANPCVTGEAGRMNNWVMERAYQDARPTPM